MSNETSNLPSRITPSRSMARNSRAVYTVPELMRMTGMSRKQVSYWTQIGLISPVLHDPVAGIGRPAWFYARAEVVKALVVCELRRAGFTPRQVQRVAENLGNRGIKLDASETYLLTDGYSVYYALNEDEVVDVLRHNRQRLLLVPIHEQVAKLEQAA